MLFVDCVYNGALFKEGESWADGCDLTCTCEDAEKGYYRCNDRYGHISYKPKPV
jgi:hypothetical protein